MRFHKSLLAQAIVGAYLIVKHGTLDGTAIVATGPNDALLGTSDSLPKAVGEMVDVDLSQEPEVTYGGAVTRGDWLTSDAQGRAVTAAPAAGVNVNVIGRAMQTGVLGDIKRYLRAPGRIQG